MINSMCVNQHLDSKGKRKKEKKKTLFKKVAVFFSQMNEGKWVKVVIPQQTGK